MTRWRNKFSAHLILMSVCVKMGTVLAQLGHGACPSWVTCLPLLGRFVVRRLPNK